MLQKNSYKIKKLDLFSKAFQFNVGVNQERKKTIFGGLISILIILISLSYFGYLTYLYFWN